ncbi:hypothetical protein CEXT_335831 [Caerostris extrusa]|uniref:Uncharacterized protein n=1 Tax=Caerostris extrusa TaxID=172846 RepID=A0AAV4M2V8_CAEEX|nr:hypothetical protein CEXT_335831 [Caerostris extrusa]
MQRTQLKTTSQYLNIDSNDKSATSLHFTLRQFRTNRELFNFPDRSTRFWPFPSLPTTALQPTSITPHKSFEAKFFLLNIPATAAAALWLAARIVSRTCVANVA